MSDSPEQNALAYLRDHNVLNLATSGPEGIWSAAVFYANEGFALYFLSAATSRHSRNIAGNPDVAGTVHEDYRDWPKIKGIQFEGAAAQLDGEEKEHAVRQYGKKFPDISEPGTAPKEIAAALVHVAWYRVRPKRIYFIDNALGFGHREEVPLS